MAAGNRPALFAVGSCIAAGIALAGTLDLWHVAFVMLNLSSGAQALDATGQIFIRVLGGLTIISGLGGIVLGVLALVVKAKRPWFGLALVGLVFGAVVLSAGGLPALSALTGGLDKPTVWI